MLKPHSNEWYDRLSETQDRYYYPWNSKLEPNHGEDNYIAILKREIKKSHTVLDVGCGSGEITNEIACLCKRVVGYDRLKRFIETANSNRQDNATFLCYDPNQSDIGRIPIEGKCINYFVSSKGPLHWIPDAARIAEKNAKIIMLCPYVEANYGWNEFLSPELQYQGSNKNNLIETIQTHLRKIGSQIDQIEFYEAEETFFEQQEFIRFITWGRFDLDIDLDGLQKSVKKIFQKYGKEDSLAIKYQRFIWRSNINN